MTTKTRKPIIITTCSFKGGTAKTSSTLNIGTTLAEKHNKRVLLVDFDAQANLTAGIGLDSDSITSLSQVFENKKSINDIIVQTSNKYCDIIPADIWLERVEMGPELINDRYSHERLQQLLKTLTQYDYIFVDTPPSLCWLSESALIAADYALVCATPEFYSIKGLERLSHFLEAMIERHNLSILGVLISLWNPRGKNNQNFIDVIDQIFPKKRFNAEIRRDIAVSEAALYGKTLFEHAPQSRAYQDYINVTNELLTRTRKRTLVNT
ncbi:ParA family protein [Chlamydiia bacterium]|nr:ParA family protein [Chlamydiia bacterium]